MDTPGNAEEIEQGLRLMRVFQKIESATVREEIIAFISRIETETSAESPQLVDTASLSIVRSTNIEPGL